MKICVMFTGEFRVLPILDYVFRSLHLDKWCLLTYLSTM